MSLTLSNSANSSSRAGLTGSFRKEENSSMFIRPPLQEVAMDAKPSSSFFTLSHFRLREQGTERRLLCRSYFAFYIIALQLRGSITCSKQIVFVPVWRCPLQWDVLTYLSLRLILVNSTRPASMGSVSSPAEIIRRQSSYVWSVTGTPRALKADGGQRNACDACKEL